MNLLLDIIYNIIMLGGITFWLGILINVVRSS
jgi:hypothetical protein